MRVSFVALLVVAAVGHAAQAQTGVTRTKRGDTTVISTQGSGRWRALEPMELLRVSSDTRETTFGQVNELQATPDGGVVLVDSKSQDGLIVRQFDANGKFVRNLGRSGPGPGEYTFAPSIAVHPDGTIYIRDGMKSVSVFGRDGKLLSSFALNHNNGSTLEIIAANDGSMYLRAPFERTGFPTNGLQRPLLHYDLRGQLLDSVSNTARWVPEGTDGFQWWKLLPDGRSIFTRNDRIAFMVVDPTGKQGPLIGEVPGGPVPLLREEREELQANRDLFREKCTHKGQPLTPRSIVAETRMPARPPGILDLDGRIWIPKAAPALKIPPKRSQSCSGQTVSGLQTYVTWEQPPAFAAFLADGTYLGEVRFPLRAKMTFVGNSAWAVVPDADDVPVLVKYRLY